MLCLPHVVPPLTSPVQTWTWRDKVEYLGTATFFVPSSPLPLRPAATVWCGGRLINLGVTVHTGHQFRPDDFLDAQAPDHQLKTGSQALVVVGGEQ